MVGNRVFGHSLILCMAIALLLTPWGSLPPDDFTLAKPDQSRVIEAPQRFADFQDANRILVNGWNGNVAIGQVMIPYWAIVACLGLGSLIASLNWLKFTQLSSVLTFAIFGMAAACSLVATIHFAIAGEVGTGSVLAITCALAGLALSPSDSPAEQPVIHRFETVQNQKRSAA